MNGTPAKSAREVRPGDLITIRTRDRITTVRVTEIPLKPPSKAMASTLYTIVKDEVIPLI
jgi:ribosomal 50S subunit-recycling heat shock protein